MKLAHRVIQACKNRPNGHDMSTESNENVNFGSENKFNQWGIRLIGFQTIENRL